LTDELTKHCKELLEELDIIERGETIAVMPLTGGVASDIARGTVGSRQVGVKFALPKLKVRADWFAPVHRNAAEYQWLQVAADVAPASAVALLGHSVRLHGFAMEFISGDDAYLWKTNLLAAANDHGEAATVGDLLGRIHTKSTEPQFYTDGFKNRDDFHALRIEPYLLYTASKHADIASEITHIAKKLHRAESVLIHGDVSPKNIFFRAGKPIILDAECATMGDASFDVAFCLNHLVLKAIHMPSVRDRYLASALTLWQHYAPSITWEPVLAIELRVCKLLPVLMLARVDGKSPVDYLAEQSRSTVRQISRQLIQSPVGQLSDLLNIIKVSAMELST